jgi:hypothetical protein
MRKQLRYSLEVPTKGLPTYCTNLCTNQTWQAMHSFMAVAIFARFILLAVHSRGAIASAPGAEANNLGHADASFLHTVDEDELLAAIVSARISEPDWVAGVLNELRVESTGHLGRLDLEEWSEMMAGMRSGGVALGNRNKLRLLVAAQSSGSHTAGPILSGDCTLQAAASPARALQEANTESSSLSISGCVYALPCRAALAH